MSCNGFPQFFSDSEADTKRLVEFEKEKISLSRDRADREHWTGVALSGGGIRSAIFCLGALQALAEKEVLKNFDYMSSVSGGGYIASALQWLWKTEPNTGSEKADFPFGTSRYVGGGTAERDRRLDYLRSHGQYLTPGEGLTIWSMFGVVIRTILLNLAVWVPLGVLILFGCITVFDLVKPLFQWLPNVLSPIPAAWRGARGWAAPLFFVICIWIAIVIVLAFTLWAFAFSIDTTLSANQRLDPNSRWRRLQMVVKGAVCAMVVGLVVWATTKIDFDAYSLGILILGAVFLVVWVVTSILQSRGSDLTKNYFWRRRFEVDAGRWLPLFVILLATGSLPIIPYLLFVKANAFLSAAAAAAGAVSGLATAVFGHNAQSQNAPPSDKSRWILMFGSAVFIYFLGCVAYVAAQLIIDPILVGAEGYENLVRGGIFAAAGFAIILGYRTNVNYVGLHRFYRDRLMEAFMPDYSAVIDDRLAQTPIADQLSISDLWPPPFRQGIKRPIPYPILNTNAVLVNDTSRKIAARGGDNFIISPLVVGSSATGWEQSTQHIGKHGPLSLASAMAASGAALNSNAAYVGAGITRDRLLSIVLMLLNVRLGIWVGKPSQEVPAGRPSIPTHFNPGLKYGLTRYGYSRASEFVELSDGGHFDNLGIYELVRREARVIVVLDGEEDPGTAMPALYSVVQRIQEDFKVQIDLDGRLDDLVAVEGIGYPSAARYVTRPFFAAPIHYPTGDVGALVYVKLSLASDVGFAAKGYRAQFSDFPHQPTSNQFFVPQQIEAYRNVGYVNTMHAITTLELDQNMDNPAAILRCWQARNSANQPQVPPQPI